MPRSADTHLAYDLRMACMGLARRVRYRSTTLPPTFFVVLVKLEHGPTTAADLAARERVSAASMSRTISELADRGFIERTQDADDKRKFQLTITPAGLAAVREARKERNEWMTAQLEGCTPDELATLRSATDILNRMLGS